MFKVQLVNIEKGRVIPDKNNKGQTLKFDVLKFVEINKQACQLVKHVINDIIRNLLVILIIVYLLLI